MTESIQVRPVIESDLPQLMGIDHSSSSDHVWQLDLRREQQNPRISATFQEVRLPRAVRISYPSNPFALADEWINKAMISVAVVGSDAIGYVALNIRRPEAAWVSDLVVAPKWRRKGVASLLLTEARNWTASRGRRRIFFEMQSKNYPAIALAQKHGYEFCGYNDQYFSNQDIGLIFARAA